MSRTHLRTVSVPVGLLWALLLLGGCGSEKVSFVYPDEAIDFGTRNLKMPAIYFDTVTDMRPAVQREGQGKFFKITYPSDQKWEVPPTQIYADALAQDLEQTHLAELVPLHSQADYILSVDLISMTCQLDRSPLTSLLVGAAGAGLGYVVGGGDSHATKLAVVAGVAAVLAVPVPTKNTAEAEIRMTLKDRSGNLLWQETCRGEFSGKKYITPTSRQDQELVNQYLTKAVKKANACLLGQLRHHLAGYGGAGE